MKARAHVAMMCMKAGCKMVDAGTQGYNGQTKTVVRGFTECHNCRPPQVEQSVAVCTIRSRPELPIHCVTYAKNFYDCFFGGDEENSFKGEIKLSEFVGDNVSDKDIDLACRSVFNALFYNRIAAK
jgi:ubiquitin-like 1-activating enzyme E1 B